MRKCELSRAKMLDSLPQEPQVVFVLEGRPMVDGLAVNSVPKTATYQESSAWQLPSSPHIIFTVDVHVVGPLTHFRTSPRPHHPSANTATPNYENNDVHSSPNRPYLPRTSVPLKYQQLGSNPRSSSCPREAARPLPRAKSPRESLAPTKSAKRSSKQLCVQPPANHEHRTY